MPAFKNLLAVGTVCLGLFQLSAAQNSVKLDIGTQCEDTLSEYILYTNPENAGGCITIGAPGFPFFADDSSTQCGDYTDGGADSTSCNNYPLNAESVQLYGNINCTFWASEDCTVGDQTPEFGTLSNADADGVCQDIPPQLPLSGGTKQTASSLTCVAY